MDTAVQHLVDVLATRRSVSWWHLFALAALCGTAACAIPGPPQPRTPAATTCPSLRVVGASPDGLLLNVGLTTHTTKNAVILLARSQDDAKLTPLVTLPPITGALKEAVDHGRPLPLLDASAPQGAVLTYVLAGAPADSSCPTPSVGIITPETLLAPASPKIDVLGLAVRIEPPEDGSSTATLYRRDVRTGEKPVVLVERWDTLEPYVDTAVEANTIYAYSVANNTPLLTNQNGEAPLIVGPRGPEAYAPITPLEEIIAP